MKVRVGDPLTAAALRWVGGGDDDIAAGLVFAPDRQLTGWDAAEDELTEAFELTREATLADAPVVYLIDTTALLGRAEPLDSAVAAGLVAGARSLAFEGRRHGRYATAIAVPAEVGPDAIAEAVGFAVASRSSLGQVLMLGADHLGAMLP